MIVAMVSALMEQFHVERGVFPNLFDQTITNAMEPVLTSGSHVMENATNQQHHVVFLIPHLSDV